MPSSPVAQHNKIRSLTTLALLLPALAVILGLAGCDGKSVKGQGASGAGGKGGKGGAGAAAARPVVVTAAAVEQKNVPILIPGLFGTVEPVETVTVRARIGGQLDKVHFVEGQQVKAGDLLFTIDSRLLRAELSQAQANLTRDEAQAENARSDARRYADLIKRGAVAPAEFEKITANYKALQASVAANRATVDNVRQQLAYTEIRSPITGRTGALHVDRGNLVKANDTDLVTINQVSPIFITFSASEQFLPVITRAMARGKVAVEASIPNDNGAPARGELTFVNNAVTQGTGQIQLRATFPNADGRLWPGQFVKDVMVELGIQEGALVAPASALQNSQEGTYVFVIRPDMTVEQRPVEVNEDDFDNQIVIARGLKAGERVVTDGHLQLVPGVSKVEIKGDRSRKPGIPLETPSVAEGEGTAQGKAPLDGKQS